ncbi:class II lanthipeptide, LchA2/BrtA2 family [Clostridium gasigenes]|uniref:class II lanthipeptide, LchA2/BrtA2 family n=1 Tax=Clostridium gasigenes TaxID=94869 RepID=UPI001C0D2F2E|nr:class II lanthipeptide, LchA2/BrtA2 family [Clostridium gasigenes]MBU3107032.1 class II lanthipeptide, LchA2/BrtA2 family [Clostridium gasigenes]
MKNELELLTGLIEENELEALSGNEDAKGGWTPVATVILTAVGITFNATPCPTSACTKSCNK